MNTHALALSLALLSLAGTGSTQTQVVVGTVVVQGASGDLVLNAPLIDALLGEAPCHDAVRKVLDGIRIDALQASLPVAHLPGTYQLHVQAFVEQQKPLTEEQCKKAIDAVVDHLRQRLDRMLYAQPREDLETRRQDLQRRHFELQNRHAELRARVENANLQRQSCQQRSRDVESQLAAVSLDIATEERAQELLERMRAEHTQLRADCTARLDAMVEERTQLQAQVSELQGRIEDLDRGSPKDKPAELQSLREQCRTSTRSVQAMKSGIDASNARAADVQRMLTVVLEQLPANAIALQRAKARQQAIDHQREQCTRELEAAEKVRADAARLEAEAEQIGIDITVTKSLLVEVEGKLARLQPLRYQVLYARQ